jgi:hypothetical protein
MCQVIRSKYSPDDNLLSVVQLSLVVFYYGEMLFRALEEKLQPNCWGASSDIEDWFHVMIIGGNKDTHSISILTLWHIWKERNARVFNRTRNSEQVVLTRIKDEFANWVSARRGNHPWIDIASMSN